MKEIIEFDFAAESEKNKESAPINEAPGEIIEADFLAEHQENDMVRWLEALRTAALLRSFLSRLKGGRGSSAARGEAAALIVDYDDKQVMEMIIGSDEKQWSKQPAFFSLLLERFDSIKTPSENEELKSDG